MGRVARRWTAARAVQIVAIDHVQLAMPAGGEAEAREFYSLVLGLTEVPKPHALAARGGAWFESDRIKIHLGVDADFRAAKKAHLALIVQELGELVDRLRNAGYDVVAGDKLPGLERVFVEDPFGNRLELIEK